MQNTTNTQNTSMPLTSDQTTEPMAVPPPAKRPKPNPNPDPDQDQTLVHCPRCDSPRTKFCYYNNYSLSQPRYFCKSCRRYWTKGGTLRNVPVGGLSRRNKKPVASVSVMQQHRRRGELQPQLTVQYDKLAVASNRTAISPSSTNLKLSCSEPSFPLFDNSEFTFEDLATSFTERNCDSKDYEGGDYFSTLMATGGYGAVTSHIHESSPFGETMSCYDAHYEKIMNGEYDYDVKPKLFESGCHLGLHGSSAERNGSSGLGLVPSWAGLASGFGC